MTADVSSYHRKHLLYTDICENIDMHLFLTRHLPPLSGHISQCFCSDPAPLHQFEPPGPGSPCCPPEHGSDQSDAVRPQPRRLCQRPGRFSV